MTTNIQLTSTNVTITTSMRDKAQAIFNKLFNRHPCLAHHITLKETPSGFELVATYQSEDIQKTARLSHADFYVGIKSVRDTLLSQFDRAVGAKQSRSRKNSVEPLDAAVDCPEE